MHACTCVSVARRGKEGKRDSRDVSPSLSLFPRSRSIDAVLSLSNRHCHPIRPDYSRKTTIIWRELLKRAISFQLLSSAAGSTRSFALAGWLPISISVIKSASIETNSLERTEILVNLSCFLARLTMVSDGWIV